eukprot:TRINITY_DN18425_c0_g1_i1.p1 TRINITY_DN18425_c0_g1~~TRINITY_DN18425_c0_g1_i1.p1  ORF type:complete len:107 (-),score=1.42 TRINITY_DN18425_c0_g1_i1:76-396(-)
MAGLSRHLRKTVGEASRGESVHGYTPAQRNTAYRQSAGKAFAPGVAQRTVGSGSIGRCVEENIGQMNHLFSACPEWERDPRVSSTASLKPDGSRNGIGLCREGRRI